MNTDSVESQTNVRVARAGCSVGRLLDLMDGNIARLCHEVFDGHESIQDAMDYWVDMPQDSAAFTPSGWEYDYNCVILLERIARIVFAAEQVLASNSASPDLGTGSTQDLKPSWHISTDSLRSLKLALTP